MKDLFEFLKDKLHGVKKLAVLGVGSSLRGDDAAGVLVIEKLMSSFCGKEHPDIRLYKGETAPENFSGEIKHFRPSHLLIIDAANVGIQPGSIMHINPEDIGGITFCTHMLPLRIMIDYLKKETGTKVTLICIQSKNITFDAGVSPEVHEAAYEISGAIQRLIKEVLYTS